MNYWLDIETAPMDTDVILGWWASVDGLNYHWEMEIGWAGASNTKPPGMSNAWRHGQATHWRICPGPPAAAPARSGETGERG